MLAEQRTVYATPGASESAGIVSALPSFFKGVVDGITGEIDHK